MADRNEAFAAWHKGIISDDELKQVINDLSTVVEVLYAMDERGFTLGGFRQQLYRAEQMYEDRKRDRK